MKVLRILGRIIIVWLLLAPFPLIVTYYLLHLRPDWNSGWHAVATLWSVPVFLLATAIDPIARGTIVMPQYALIYLALTIVFIVVRRWLRARRAARASAEV